MQDLKLFTYKMIGYILGFLGAILLIGGRGVVSVGFFFVGAFLVFKSNKQRVIIYNGRN